MSAIFLYKLPLKDGEPVPSVTSFENYLEWLVYGQGSWLKTHYPNFNIDDYTKAEMRDNANWQKLGGIDSVTPIVENGKITGFEYSTVLDYDGSIVDDAEMVGFHDFFYNYPDWTVPGSMQFIKNTI